MLLAAGVCNISFIVKTSELVSGGCCTQYRPTSTLN